ncbi:SRPBCC domain-containing protein [Dyadobacter sp. CY327]|uniref:SRPBCC family protein n=1 Tax=Dyadobacter sp. CY327 TaxID=2907301 RepID=UPI001F2CBB06|nr:SRPBCC domain-containing protein [Dyadobacter sp. CY327]MCE7070557.1 SRPBCC domain-containing protein [Dyadobacter sp. CY327]
MEAQEKELTISHLFDAGIDRVFQAWTDPEKLKHWYAPDRCLIEYKSIEVKEGGRFHYCIQHPLHGKNWVIGTYIEIVPPSKIVFTMQFSNENGEEINNMADKQLATWPQEIITTVTFESLGNQTKALIHETVSEDKAKTTGAYRGWIQMFDKLNQQLARL